MDVKSSLKRKLKVVFSVFEGCVCVCVYLSIDQSIDRYNGYEKLTDFFSEYIFVSATYTSCNPEQN